MLIWDGRGRKKHTSRRFLARNFKYNSPEKTEEITKEAIEPPIEGIIILGRWGFPEKKEEA